MYISFIVIQSIKDLQSPYSLSMNLIERNYPCPWDIFNSNFNRTLHGSLNFIISFDCTASSHNLFPDI